MEIIYPSKILCVGLNCVDVISECSTYPAEDDKVGSTTSHNRCISQRWQRGGNASNITTVLSLLRSSATLLCTVANSNEKEFLLTDMADFGIKTEHIVYHDGYSCPTSVVLCSLATGSRTIVHSNQNLPEVTVDDLKKLPLSSYNWIHFEGRNIEAVVEMQKAVAELAPGVPVSVELEKPRSDLEKLVHNTDVIFASKDYAKFLGFNDMMSAVEGIAKKAGSRCHTVIVPWGDRGACARHRDESSGEVSTVTSPAFPPDKVVDTLGAGDTFLAATIHALAKGQPLKECITFGCRVAGFKVGVKGWKNLKDTLPNALV